MKVKYFLIFRYTGEDYSINETAGRVMPNENCQVSIVEEHYQVTIHVLFLANILTLPFEIKISQQLVLMSE